MLLHGFQFLDQCISIKNAPFFNVVAGKFGCKSFRKERLDCSKDVFVCVYHIQLQPLIATSPIPMPRAVAVDQHKRLAWALRLRPCERIQCVKMDAIVKLAVHLINEHEWKLEIQLVELKSHGWVRLNFIVKCMWLSSDLICCFFPIYLVTFYDCTLTYSVIFASDLIVLIFSSNSSKKLERTKRKRKESALTDNLQWHGFRCHCSLLTVDNICCSTFIFALVVVRNIVNDQSWCLAPFQVSGF